MSDPSLFEQPKVVMSQGDILPVLRQQLLGSNGNPADLTQIGTSVNFVMRAVAPLAYGGSITPQVSAAARIIATSQLAITAKSISNQIATIVLVSPHGVVPGTSIVLAGNGDVFDGVWLVLETPTPQSLTFLNVTSDVALITTGITGVMTVPGVVEYDWTAPDTSSYGKFGANFTVTYPSGGTETFPSEGYIEIEIVPSSPTITAAFSELLGDRQYISQYASDATVGFVVNIGGVPTNVQGAVTYVMATVDGATTIATGTADNPAAGVYQFSPSSVMASAPGLYRVTFSYTVNSQPQIYVGILEVGSASPAYDALSSGFKQIVENVWVRFADLFDSPIGGPHLQVYFQARFTRNRMAQLLQMAVNRLNTISQPHMIFTLNPQQDQFPYTQWEGLLDEGLYVEAIKHLIRSYTEQPAPEGVQVARQDRRDYMQRWMQVLEIEQRDYDEMKDNFKISFMSLSRPVVLVSGGVYGDYGPIRLPGNAIARPHTWAIYY